MRRTSRRLSCNTASRNKPEYLPRIAQTLAELRGMPLEEIARITTENALSALPALRPQAT